MKPILAILSAILIIIFPACAQKLKESQVPASVTGAFKKQFPNTNATWEKEGMNYEVNFKHDGKTMSSVIDANGSILETETDMATADLPAAIRTYVKEHYSNASIKEAAKIVKANGEVTYEALVKGKDVIFDANGKFLKEEKEEKD